MSWKFNRWSRASFCYVRHSHGCATLVRPLPTGCKAVDGTRDWVRVIPILKRLRNASWVVGLLSLLRHLMEPAFTAESRLTKINPGGAEA